MGVILKLFLTATILSMLSPTPYAFPSTKLHISQNHFFPTSRVSHFKSLIQKDSIRGETIAHRLAKGKLRSRSLPSGRMPIFSAADYGMSQYLVKLKIGSPPQTMVLVLDTGSDLTWMKCNYPSSSSFKIQPHHHVFEAGASSSFSTTPCSSYTCKTQLSSFFSLSHCPSSSLPCSFDYSYADESRSLGVFANETITLEMMGRRGRRRKVRGVMVGCAKKVSGRALSLADGVMGLGYEELSLSKKVSGIFGGRFSYCLMEHLSRKNTTSFLTFGKSTGIDRSKFQYTRLILGVFGSFYGVKIEGVSVDGANVKIPGTVWEANQGGGAILDSGSSLTTLVRGAYGPVMAALKGGMRGYEEVKVEEIPVGLEFCVNGTGFEKRRGPKMVIHLRGGGELRPELGSYLIDAGGGVRCLGFVEGGEGVGVNVIGGIMQQEHVWEFDLRRKVLGFAAADCGRL